ncbi:S41 family peptidase [Acanthopleuribacter pedis]|uniref:S41 family peptidase n=1 Tax=Acanthopleuribacter pedis TaxID=442870 RepID=A0A8J7QAX3_9BACT|nr:S41 family peptidase [Acanthopleuribacter pedis]MBO1317471.1 S41 family peptidase [Acanthopleuribacter pedis]
MNSILLLTTLLLFQTPVTENVLTCPHYRTSEIWDTHVSLYNPQRVAQPVTVTAYHEDGSPAGTTVWTLPAEGGLDGGFSDLFPAVQSDNGWFEIRDPSGVVQGNLTYAFSLTGAAATVPFQEEHGRRQVIPLLENDGLWHSGLALTNPGQTENHIQLTLKFEDGRPADVVDLALAPGQKQVGMLHNLFNTTPERGQLIVTAREPLSVLALAVGPAFLQLKAQNGEVLGHVLDRPVTDLAEVQGNWRRLGYAGIMEIVGDEVALRHTIDESCVTPYFELPMDALRFEMFFQEDDVLRVEVGFTKETYYFERLDVLPEPCGINPDPLANFEAFVLAYQQHFAFFDALDFDWNARIEAARTKVNAQTSPVALFQVLSELLEATGDGHGELDAGFDDVGGGLPGPFQLDVYQHFMDQNEIAEFEEFYAQQIGLWEQLLVQYVSELKVAGNGKIVWGRLNEHTGYVLIREMSGYSGENLIVDEFALEDALDQVFADLGHLPAMVVDNRWNPGGVDAFAIQTARRFADQRRLAYSETGRFGEGFLPWRSHWTEPHPERTPYQGEVVYLTSSNTGSGAEVMTFLMRVLPNVVHLGERTAGALSDSLDLALPNGWSLSFSNEIYLDHQGEWYEYRGIPAAITMPHFPREDRLNQRDSILEKAIQLTQP